MWTDGKNVVSQTCSLSQTVGLMVEMSLKHVNLLQTVFRTDGRNVPVLNLVLRFIV